MKRNRSETSKWIALVMFAISKGLLLFVVSIGIVSCAKSLGASFWMQMLLSFVGIYLSSKAFDALFEKIKPPS